MFFNNNNVFCVNSSSYSSSSYFWITFDLKVILYVA